MTVSLDALERARKRELREKAGQLLRSEGLSSVSKKQLLILFGCAAFAAPFVISVGIFVPFFGQVVFLMVIAATVLYLLCMRSWSRVVAVVAGIIAGLSLLGAVITHFQNDMAAMYYVLLAFSVFVSVAAIVLLIGQIWQHYENARIRVAETATTRDIA